MDQLESSRYGVATFDHGWYWLTVKLGATLTSRRHAIQRLTRETDQLIKLVRATDINQASDRVKVARLMGMEPISCDWSLLMIVDHLQRFVHDMTRLVDALANSKQLHGQFSDEQYDPSEEVGVDVIDRFEDSVADFRGSLSSNTGPRGGATFRHSWLGRMNSHQWLCWTAAHIGIHRRHAQKILSVSGVV